MSSMPEVNVYSSTATELQSVSSLTEEGKLYREAAREVLARSANRDAGPSERALIMSMRTLDELLETVNEERNKNKLLKERAPSKLLNSTRSVVDSLDRFEKAITSMAQTKPEVMMLVWGPIQFLVRVASEVFDTLDQLDKMGQHIRHCLTRYKALTSGPGVTGPLLRGSLTEFYAHIIQFSITVSKIYRKRTKKMARFVFQTSVKAPFDKFMDGLDYLSDVIHKDVNVQILLDSKGRSHSPPRLLCMCPQRNDVTTLTKSFRTANPDQEGELQRKRHFIVPDLLSITFSGREDLLSRIYSSLHQSLGSEISRTALWGIPGIGKTQIAIRYATDFRSEYTYIFFINASTSETINTSYRGLVQTLFADRDEVEGLDASMADILVKGWLANHTNWLLIYDNANEPSVVRSHTPTDGAGHIIFTSRGEIAAEAMVGSGNSHEIYALPPGDAVTFVLRLQNILQATQCEQKLAERLARTLMGVPIAIEQAVLLARLRKISLPEIIPEVERRRVLFKQSHPASMHEGQCSLGALVSMTLDTLAMDSPQAAALFRLLAYFDPSSIPVEFLTNAPNELQHHFARLATYDRGFDHGIAVINKSQKQAAADRPFYESNPFEKEFWKSRIPFRSRPANVALPRVDSNADKVVESFFNNSNLLQEVLGKDVRIENAILDLQKAGLVRRLNDKTIWIHDMLAELTIALVEEESQPTHQATAHMVLLLIYFLFPRPERYREKAICFEYLPHAMKILQHCRPFYNDLTVGPELAHLTASTFASKISEFFPTNNNQHAVGKAIEYYTLAHTGYHHAWRRLLNHPLVSEREIVACAKAEYAEQETNGSRSIYTSHLLGCQRFGSSAAVRLFQTCLKLGARVYQPTKQYNEAVKWTERALQGVQAIYGAQHEETYQAWCTLLRLYKRVGCWLRGYTLGRAMAADLLKRFEGRLPRNYGGQLASDIADCARGLGDVEDATRWYNASLRALIHLYGEDNKIQLLTLIKIARLESSMHAHGKSLRLMEKGLGIYEKANQKEPHKNMTCPEQAVELHVAIASQQFELAKLAEAKDSCQNALRLCAWHPEIDRADYADYRPLWDAGLEAIWLLGCIELDPDDHPQQWENTPFKITKELSREALEKFGPLRRPCCGKQYGDEGWNPGGGMQKQLQKMLEELG